MRSPTPPVTRVADVSGSARCSWTGPVLQRAGRRLGRLVLVALYTATVSLGALTTPLAPLLGLSLVLALGVGALYRWAYRAQLHDRPPRHQVVNAGFAGAGVLPFVSGALLLGVLGVAVTLAVLALAVVVVGGHLVATDLSTVLRRLPAAVGTGAGDDAAGADEAALRALLRRAPLQLLFRRWHATGRTVGGTRSGERYEMAVYLRELLLDELHTRDPAGAQRWLDQGGAQPPERHIRSDRPAPG